MRKRWLLSIVMTASLVGCSSGDITPGTGVTNPNSKQNSMPNGLANGGGGGGGNGDGGTIGNGDGGTVGGGDGGMSGGGGGGGGGPGGGFGGSAPTQIAGGYDVTTQYNLLDALPPDVANILQLALSFADSPGAFLLDQADKLPVIKYVIDAINLFSGVRDQIVSAIDEYINGWSGGMVNTMHNLSQDIEAALRGLKAHNHLVLTAPDAGGNLKVDDTLVDLTFTYQGVDYPYPQAAKSTGVAATFKGLKLDVQQHTYDHGVNIGGLLVDLIDNVALPNLTGVSSLGDLLNQLVDCGGVASWVWSYIANICIGQQCISSYISADDITKLCQNALNAAGQAIEDKIASLDAPGMMSMSEGTALMIDNHNTMNHADTIKSGAWALTLPIGVGNITLPGTFDGVSAP
jgi:hypothetical protein